MTGRSRPPPQTVCQCPDHEKRISEEVAAPLVWLTHQNVDPLDAGPTHPEGGASEVTRQVMKQAADADGKVTSQLRRMTMDPELLERISEGDQENSRAGSIDLLDDAIGLGLGKVAVVGSLDPKSRDQQTEPLSRAVRNALLSPQEEDAHPLGDRAFAELRHQVRPHQVVWKPFPRQTAGQIHAGPVVEEQVGPVQDLAKRAIPPGEVQGMGIDDVHLPGFALSEAGRKRGERVGAAQTVESDAEESDLVSRGPQAVPVGRRGPAAHGSCSSGRRATKRSGITDLSSCRRTTWKSTSRIAYTRAPPRICRGRGREEQSRSQIGIAAAATAGRRISASRSIGKISRLRKKHWKARKSQMEIIVAQAQPSIPNRGISARFSSRFVPRPSTLTFKSITCRLDAKRPEARTRTMPYGTSVQITTFRTPAAGAKSRPKSRRTNGSASPYTPAAMGRSTTRT